MIVHEKEKTVVFEITPDNAWSYQKEDVYSFYAVRQGFVSAITVDGFVVIGKFTAKDGHKFIDSGGFEVPYNTDEDIALILANFLDVPKGGLGGGGGGGSTTLLGLTDTPSSYGGQAGRKLVVKEDEMGIEFIDEVNVGTVEYRYRFLHDNAETDPTVGHMKLNNADYSLATEVYISETDVRGNSHPGAMMALKYRDVFIIHDANTNDYVVFHVSGPGINNTGWWTIPVTHARTIGIAFNENERVDVGMIFLGAKTFLGLQDTPADYAGQAGKTTIVNATEDGLEFGDAGAGTFAALTDTPADYVGHAGKAAVVNGAESALEFAAIATESILQVTITDANATDPIALAVDTKRIEVTLDAALTVDWAPSAITGVVPGVQYDVVIIKKADVGVDMSATVGAYFEEDIDPWAALIDIDTTQQKAVITAYGLGVDALEFTRLIMTDSRFVNP